MILGPHPVVCKLCRYYTDLLLKPPQTNTQKAAFVKNYHRRLLSFHNVEVGDEEDNDSGDQQRRKSRNQGRKEESRGMSGGQIVLDNDVMVDYDVPIIDPVQHFQQQNQKLKSRQHPDFLIPRSPAPSSASQKQRELASETSRVLRGNPNISIRELFPGEDELGLQVNFPFGQGGMRTPEGWTRVTSTVQYDDATRQLWEELQKPYGNQSSFIRHLVLLEKYFRNGDLVLSQNASSSAVTYSESVQNRLKSFDNVSSENLSLLQQLSNAPITITSSSNKSSAKSKAEANATMASLLKTNNLMNGRAIEIFPAKPSGSSVGGSKKGDSDSGLSIIKKSINNLPPDLISITTTGGNKTSPANNVQTININSAPTAPVNHPKSGQSSESQGAKEKSPGTSSSTSESSQSGPSGSNGSKEVIVKLPDTLSPHERKLVNGKAWRPTLMPVIRIEPPKNGINTLFQTADERLLPNRVQVMSGGKPYHISIYDYNRMCILRREKLIQKTMNRQNQNQSQNSESNSPGSSPKDPATANSTPSGSPSHNPSGFSSMPKIPNKILEQNSVIPVVGGSSNQGNSKSVRRTSSASLLKNSSATLTSKSSGIPSGTSVVAQPPITSTISGLLNAQMTVTSSPMNNPAMWMWNQDASSSGGMESSNAAAAASLLSKIPKSLTVIPQQKTRTISNSAEDQ